MATGARAAPIPGMAATQRSGRAAMRRSSWRLGVVSLLATAPLAGAATLYVAPLASFEPTAAGLRYVPGPNQAVPVTLGTNAFTDFGDAVTVANTNADTRNTICVAPGGFDVAAPQVRVSKDLTVSGAGSGATIVRATTNTPAQTGDGRAFLLVDRGVSLHLSQLAIEGMAPASIAAAPRCASRRESGSRRPGLRSWRPASSTSSPSRTFAAATPQPTTSTASPSTYWPAT